jgi:transketolase
MQKDTSKIRLEILDMAYRSQEGHVPSAFSIVEIIYTIYSQKIMKTNSHDLFLLSKGHGCLALYSVLRHFELINKSDLLGFATFDGILGGHPDRTQVPGVINSSGSLGHGLPMAVGMSLVKKIRNENGNIFVLIGDGEANEGSIWESALFASHHKLENLICLMDFNHSTDRALELGNLEMKFQSFGWKVVSIDGHDNLQIANALDYAKGPLLIICNTIKGKGIKEMENNPAWHHSKIPNSEIELFRMELS